jgi:four helix bundle protein
VKIQSFEEIIAWQKAKVLTVELRTAFKDIQDFTFKDQIFRAVLSITNNIAEGFARDTDKEFKHFLHIARGSTAEVRSMILIAPDFGYISSAESEKLSVLAEEISKILSGFIKSLN